MPNSHCKSITDELSFHASTHTPTNYFPRIEVTPPPLWDILDFSIFSCMRVDEVSAITWSNVDEAQKALLVQDRKDPRRKPENIC
mgnify:CR=1 FL=1